MTSLQSPTPLLRWTLVYVLAVSVVATLCYMAAGWSFADASYMVALTIYTVGYGEVHPIDTPYLHAVTMGTMVLGCTGMIVLTGALVQFLTITQLQQAAGQRRRMGEIRKLENHVVVVGFGRIGLMLARGLAAAGSQFVILDQDEKRAEEVRSLGFLCVLGDATDEDALRAAGIERARTLATVLPNDAANVFIALSARSLSPKIEIIARGERPSTEAKLLQAGADRVVMPTHIGAERMVELILFPETARLLRESARMNELERTLRQCGLDLDVAVVPEQAAVVGATIEEVERLGAGRFFVLQLERRDGTHITNPEQSLRLRAGDGVVIVSRFSEQARRVFDAPAPTAGVRRTDG